MNKNLKLSLDEYCLNKKNISTILKNSLLFMDLKKEKVVELPPKKKKKNGTKKKRKKKSYENKTLHVFVINLYTWEK